MFAVHEDESDGVPSFCLRFSLLRIDQCVSGGTEYVRVGSYKKKLHDHPEKERELWRVCSNGPLLKQVSPKKTFHPTMLLSLIDYPNYFHMMHQPLPITGWPSWSGSFAEKIINSRDWWQMP